MIRDLIIDDVNECIFLENKSSVYPNGSVWNTRNCGQCKVVGLLEKHKGYYIFLVEFNDGTLVKARHTNLKNGTINNPYSKNICGVACTGRVKDASKNFLYEHWKQMIYRCYDENHIRYYDYGKRGIKVDDKWLCFEYFLNDISLLDGCELLKNGRYFQIDRKNNNENYSLENCRIVTAKENSRNKRNNVFIKVFKNNDLVEIGYLTDISDRYNLARTTIKRRTQTKSIVDNIEFQFATRKEYEEYETNKRRVTKGER